MSASSVLRSPMPAEQPTGRKATRSRECSRPAIGLQPPSWVTRAARGWSTSVAGASAATARTSPTGCGRCGQATSGLVAGCLLVVLSLLRRLAAHAQPTPDHKRADEEDADLAQEGAA